MDLETTKTNAAAKLPLLKQGEYEMWRLRIEQYFQIQDYGLWDVIENGNPFKPISRAIANADGTSTSMIPGENISQEDLNLIFLRSLPSKWNTYVVFWRNKPDLETMSFDDLYNNFKIVEQEVKRTGTSSSNSSSQNMAFVSTPGSTNEANTVNVQVSTANSSVSTDSTLDSTANLSDATVYAFLANQPNGSQLVHEDLEQIHEDDLEEMDLKWQLALLSMRARKYYQRTGKKITINGSDTAGYDKSKVECFNCHKMGHFARECRGPRNQESRPRNQDSSRRTMNVEDTYSKAMVAIDGAGFDWIFMAEEEVTTNMALALSKSEFNLATYKRGLASVEEQLVFYKKNEVMFCDQIAILKRDASFKDSEINALKIEIEKLKNEKESNQIKINKFENASKRLDKLIGSQIFDNSRKGVGYNAVPPLPTGLFALSIIDLSYSGLEEFQQPEFEGYGPKSVCVDTSNEVKKTSDTPLVEDLVLEKEKQTVFPKQQDKTARKPVKYAEMYRSQKPKGNQRNWNNLKSQQLGSDFMMYNKACFVCRSFDHIQAHCKYHQRERMVYGNNYNKVNYNYTTNMTHPNSQRNMAPRAVLIKTDLKSFNTARTVNTAHPKSTVFSAKPLSRFSKSAQSTVKKPYQSKTVLTNKKFSQKVNTAKVKVNTIRDNQENAVKASACWGIPPTDDQGYVDIGCSRHMTGNISYLSDFQEFDEGYVTFEGGMCGKKNYVLFIDTACFVLSLDFKLPDERQILLKIPRKNNMYSVDMKNIIPKESLTYLVAKATLDELMLWHRRLGHINFKTINKHVKDNLVRVTDDYSRFTWVFFLDSKDETSGILKNFITEIENLVDKKVKIIRCDNGTDFKNRVINEFCKPKGIKREYSIARTPQQNGVAERRNRTLIEAARTMLADSKLPTTFWAEAVNTACNVQNMLIIVKPRNKTPYELFRGRTPALSFMRPFRCHVSILNTLDNLDKFVGKSDYGFFVGYSLTSKAFRVYNIRTRKLEKNLHIRFLEDKPIVSGDGPKWLFDIDILTKSMNYVPVIVGTNSNDFAGSEVSIGKGTTSKETDTSQDYIVMPLWKDSSLFDSPSMSVSHDEPEPSCDAKKKDDKGVSKASGVDDQERPQSSTPNINTAGPSINTASANLRTGSQHINTLSPTVLTTRSNRPQSLLDIISLRVNVTPEATNVDLFCDETEMDMSNLNASYHVPTTLNTRIHKDHSLDHVIGDIQSGVQTRGMTKTANEQELLSVAYERKLHEDLNTCLFSVFYPRKNPKGLPKL
ncbi:putative ribonuclease H-like domain-containing protein [Tanacetum coccineum]